MSKYGLALATLLASTSLANATVILTFGQTSGTPITATENAALTQTTLTATDAAVTVTQLDAAVSTPISAFFDLNATSTGAAVPIGNGAAQHYAGSFSVTSATGGGGVDYLSGTFTDLLFGAGQGAALASGAPPDTIAFSSTVITTLGLPAAIALAFANVTPDFVIDGSSIASFTSSVSGTFSANKIPEPGSLAVLAVGAMGTIFLAKRRRRT